MTKALASSLSTDELRALAARYSSVTDKAALAAGRAIRFGARDAETFLAIFNWKTRGRGRSRPLSNSPELIADALDAALSAKTERVAIAALLALRGVAIPVASAILTCVDPKRFTVIDFRALEALGRPNSHAQSIEAYFDYLAECRALAGKHRMSLRDVDRALWQWSVENGRQESNK
jgi:hypothetical protein